MRIDIPSYRVAKIGMRSHNDNILSQRKTNRCGKLPKASSLCSHISSCKKYPHMSVVIWFILCL